jgi:hypothetical protein
LKYKRFKGGGHQDVDDWFSEFESTAIANQEEDEAKQRIFQGLLKGEALKWYQDVLVRDRNDWDQLTTAFLQAFWEVGGEARALGRLSKMTMRTSESVRKYSDSDSDSESSDLDESDSASSGSEEEQSPSPPRPSHQSKGAREKAIVKVKTEDPEQRRMMKSIEDTLEAIKVNLAENWKPRQTIPTSRMNVWCARYGDPGHYASECQRPTPKRIHYVNSEEEVFYAQPEEEEEEASAIYQVQPTYGRGKGPSFRSHRV